jgi:hypothetical protein
MAIAIYNLFFNRILKQQMFTCNEYDSYFCKFIQWIKDAY